MPAITARAPGKIILIGEHAVVYGRPAIAVPVHQVQARATVSANIRGKKGQVRLQAPEIGLDENLENLAENFPLAVAVRSVTRQLGIEQPPACTIRITSTIPVASGLGSGAAVSVAVVRALSAFLGHPLSDEQVSSLAFEVERLYHGTPSGIDNTVITYARPVFYVRGEPIQTFSVPAPFTLVIGDTGVASPTSITVGDVRQAWRAQPGRYEALFDRVGEIALQARQLIEQGRIDSLGPLLDQNHELLREMGVSSAELERLVGAARQAGATGAKLSGGGRGGNMVALVEPEAAVRVANALQAAGARQTIVTTVGEPVRKRA